jgi:zinc protease
VLVGDFEPARALELIARHFGAFPKAPRPIPKVTTVEPPQEGERRVVVRRAGPAATVALAWMRPGANDPGFFAFDVLASVLGDGISSRLSQALVESKLATSVSAWNGTFADPFPISCRPRSPTA